MYFDSALALLPVREGLAFGLAIALAFTSTLASYIVMRSRDLAGGETIVSGLLSQAYRLNPSDSCGETQRGASL